jgi:hypothetical protein
MLKKLIELMLEQRKMKKAMNLLAKQEWSVDFLVYLLRKSQIRDISIRITQPNGTVMEIRNTTTVQNNYNEQEQQMSQDEWDVLLGIK